MPEFHVNPLTGKSIICRKVNECDAVSGHYSSREEAESEHVRKLTQHLLEVEATHAGVTDGFRQRDRWSIPDDVLRVLSGWVTDSPEKVVAVVPSGSLLYNTSMPGVPMHDYDFMVFIEDDEKWSNYRHVMIGLVDLFIVPLRMIEKYVTHTQVVEGWSAVMTDQWLLLDETAKSSDNLLQLQYQDAEHGFLLYEYFSNIAEYIDKHAQKVYPEVRLVRERKHMLRWKLYVARDSSRNFFNPRLTDVEREDWLRAVSS